jgi:hypothetical protein
MTKKKFLILLAFLLSPLAAYAFTGATSQVDANVPGTSQSLSSAPVRSNFSMAKSELSLLRGLIPLTSTINSVPTFSDGNGTLRDGKCTIDPTYGSYNCATSGSSPGMRIYHTGTVDIADFQNNFGYGMGLNKDGQATFYAYNSPAVSISSAAGGANRDLKIGGSKNFEFWNGNMRRQEPGETFCLGTNPSPTNGCYPGTDTMTLGGTISPNSYATTWSVLGLQDFYFDMTNTGGSGVYANVTGIRNYFRVMGTGANKTASKSSVRGIDNHVELGTHIQGLDGSTTLIAANKSEISFSGTSRAFSSGTNSQPGVFLNYATMTGVANNPASRSSGSALFWGNYFGGDDNAILNPIKTLSGDKVVGYAFAGQDGITQDAQVKPIWVKGSVGVSYHEPRIMFGDSPAFSVAGSSSLHSGCAGNANAQVGICDVRSWGNNPFSGAAPSLLATNSASGTDAETIKIAGEFVTTGSWTGHEYALLSAVDTDKASDLNSFAYLGFGQSATSDANQTGAATVNAVESQVVTCDGSATYTISNMIPAGSWVLGVTVKPTSISGPTSYSVGTVANATLWGSAVATGTTTSSANWNITAMSETFYAAATSVKITANGGNCSSGTFRVALHRLYATGPTS